jgi:hypothetical protein
VVQRLHVAVPPSKPKARSVVKRAIALIAVMTSVTAAAA